MKKKGGGGEGEKIRKRKEKIAPSPPPNKPTQQQWQQNAAFPHLQSGMAWQPDWKSRAAHRGPPTTKRLIIPFCIWKEDEGGGFSEVQMRTELQESTTGHHLWAAGNLFSARRCRPTRQVQCSSRGREHEGPGSSRLGLAVHTLHHGYSRGWLLVLIIGNIYSAWLKIPRHGAIPTY